MAVSGKPRQRRYWYEQVHSIGLFFKIIFNMLFKSADRAINPVYPLLVPLFESLV
jgi:hypothetical protein